MIFADSDASGATRWLRTGIAAICAVLLLSMMTLTVVDVLGRYLFNAPVPGASELTELMLAAVIFTGLPAASLDNEHIVVDAMTSRLSGPMSRLLDRAVATASGLILGVVAWRLARIGDQIGSYGGTTPTLKLAIAPVAYGVALLCVVAALVTFAAAFRRQRHG